MVDVQQQVNSAFNSAIIYVIGGVVLSLVIIFFVLRYVRSMSGADLRTTGIAAQARILKLWDTGTTINNHPVAGMVLEVQNPNGMTYEVETKSMIPRLSAGQLQPGATVRVKIDPRNQQRVALDLYGA